MHHLLHPRVAIAEPWWRHHSHAIHVPSQESHFVLSACNEKDNSATAAIFLTVMVSIFIVWAFRTMDIVNYDVMITDDEETKHPTHRQRHGHDYPAEPRSYLTVSSIVLSWPCTAHARLWRIKATPARYSGS